MRPLRHRYGPPLTEHDAAYLAGWLRALKADSRLVVVAAAQAQKALDYILGLRPGGLAEGADGTEPVDDAEAADDPEA